MHAQSPPLWLMLNRRPAAAGEVKKGFPFGLRLMESSASVRRGAKLRAIKSHLTPIQKTTILHRTLAHTYADQHKCGLLVKHLCAHFLSATNVLLGRDNCESI